MSPVPPAARVLHVDSAAGWRGGQNQVRLTASGQAARGWHAVLACRRGGVLAERARAAGLEVRALRFGGDLHPAAVWGLRRLLRELRPQVLHLHDPHALAAGLLATRLAGLQARPRVLASRRVDFRLQGRLSRAKYRACDRVLVVSRAIAEVLERDGLERERLCLVYEGVPDRPAQPGGRDELARLGIPPGAPVVGNIAALTDHKDHATLIEAVRRLRDRGSAVRLLIVGDGERRSALEAQVRRDGLRERVLFAGFRDDLDRLLPAFDVFCLSSHMEGLGTSLLDAMCFARPVVACAAGGIPEAVEDGVTGRLVAPRDPAALAAALGEVLADAALAQGFGRAGRRRFEERFSAERMVTATLAAYAEVLGASGSTPA